MGLLSELRRRNVLRMAALYAVVAWLLMQVAEVVIALANLPNWIGPAVLGFLAIGLPIALVLSWFYELTPDGLSLDTEVKPGESIVQVTGRRLDFLVISLLVAAVILFATEKWWFTRNLEVNLPPPNSIAVMAFANMSQYPEQEYFSDGLSEELLNLLARIPELKVISRTSAFYFKNKDIKLADIAKQLNVAYILEGSVRKDGKNIRVTAQLIETVTDTHVWSQTYNRELGSVFAVQDEIAAQVVNKLKVKLLGEFPKAPRAHPDAFTLILEARHFRLLQSSESLKKAQNLYEQALDIDPDYAQAWASLSFVYMNQVEIGERPLEEGINLAEEAAKKALEINPNSATAYNILALLVLQRDADLDSAARYYEKALALAPDDQAIKVNAGFFLRSLGRIDEAILFGESYIQHDPVNAIAHFRLGDMYLSSNDLQKARASLMKTLSLSPEYVGANYLIGLIDLFEGNGKAALTRFANESDDEYRIKGRALGYFALGRKEDSDTALSELISNWGQEWPPEVAHVYAYRGEIDKAFGWLADEDNNSGGWNEGRFEPLLKNLHNDPRWESFLDKMGLSNKDLSEINFEISILE